MVRKEWTQSRWKEEADMWFSRFIRLRDKGNCYTCPYINNWKKLQCGHFVPRQHLQTRYDEKNCHAQCYSCNMLHNGQGATFAVRLERDFGLDLVKELEAKRWITTPGGLDYKKISEEYKQKFETLLAQENKL